MADRLPLPTLLSAALVAFTVEFDNEAEHRMPHRTTDRGPSPRGTGPFLVSQVMWSNVLQYVGEDGISLGRLHALARTRRDLLAGLRRWGYLLVDPVAGGPGTRSAADDQVVRPTVAGRAAQDVWRPLGDVIEGRWVARFGSAEVAGLRASLQELAARLPYELPDYLPVVYPTQNGKAEVPAPRDPDRAAREGREGREGRPDGLSLLLSQVLLAFTVDFERESRISLPISANTLRVLDDVGIRTRDLPSLTGVSKEANSMCVGFLSRHGCAVVEPDPGATRGKVVRLTAKGERAQAKYRRVLAATGEAWEARYGGGPVRAARTCLERLVGPEPTAARSPLYQGLTPYPDGWRASVRTPATLPHYPMVLHRGGFPDGS